MANKIAQYESIISPNTTLEIEYKRDDLPKRLFFIPLEGVWGDTVSVAIAQGRGGESWELGNLGSEEVTFIDSRKEDLKTREVGRTYQITPNDFKVIAQRLIGGQPDKLEVLQTAVVRKAQDVLNRIEAVESAAMYKGIMECSSPNGEGWLNSGITNCYKASTKWNASSGTTPYKDLCNAVRAMMARGGEPQVIVMSPVAWNCLINDEEFKHLFNASQYVHLAELPLPEMESLRLSYVGGSAAFSGAVLDIIVDNSKSCPKDFCVIAKYGFGRSVYNAQPIAVDANQVMYALDASDIPQMFVEQKGKNYNVEIAHEFTFYPNNVYDFLPVLTLIDSDGAFDNMKRPHYLTFVNKQGLEIKYKATSGGEDLILNNETFTDGGTSTMPDFYSIDESEYTVKNIEVDGELLSKSDVYADGKLKLSDSVRGVAWVNMACAISFTKGSNVSAVPTTMLEDVGGEVKWKDIKNAVIADCTFASGYTFDKATLNGVDLDDTSVIVMDGNKSITIVAKSV